MIRLALPKGPIQAEVAGLLDRAGLPVTDYGRNSRLLRLDLPDAGTAVRIFQERDIPIQIALGNYDLGICRLSWIEELLVRFPSEGIVKLRDLGIGREDLYLASAGGLGGRDHVRIAGEFGNLAEAVAMHARLPAYRNLTLWGAVDAYPPEDADLVIMAGLEEEQLYARGLRPLWRLLSGSAWLIANRESILRKDLGPVLQSLMGVAAGEPADREVRLPAAAVLAPPEDGHGALPSGPAPLPAGGRAQQREAVRLAVPDGHAQVHTQAALDAAGLRFDGYGQGEPVRRPRSNIDGLAVKVIRPQDMPQQVALGQFDLAITGRDWLRDHTFRFPSSPVEEVVDLGRSRYQLAAAVSDDLPATNLGEALEYWRSQGNRVIRIASEYVNVADEYARYHHFGPYRVIPITGASEAFVPEDAEILIEGTETGRSFQANRLHAIDTLFISTNCVIANKQRPSGAAGRLIDELIERLRAAPPEDGHSVPAPV